MRVRTIAKQINRPFKPKPMPGIPRIPIKRRYDKLVYPTKKIGIGVVTCNRLESFKRTILGIEQNTKIPYDLFISVDGSNDGTVEWIKEKGYSYIHSERKGVCHAKNAILRHFKDYEYIFIVEDDVVFKKGDVFDLYIKAMIEFDIHHFNFLTPQQRIPAGRNITKNGITVMYSKCLGGSFATFTKTVINKVGAFNHAFSGYGYGHCEHTLRISRAGLTSKWTQFAHVVNSEEYIYHDNSAHHALTSKEIEANKKFNSRILHNTIHNLKCIYIPLKESK